MKQGQSAVLAPKKEEFYPRVQSDPQLGGEGSGFPPRFYVALGQHNHTMLGIDLGSESIRVAILEEDTLKNIVSSVPACLALKCTGDWVHSKVDDASQGWEHFGYLAMIKSIRTKLGTDSRDHHLRCPPYRS